MKRLLAGIRWRLVGWSMLTLALILGALGATVYVALERSLDQQLDRNLVSRSEQAGPVLFPRGGGPRPPQREGYSGGVFYLAFGPGGVVFANPQQVALTADALPEPEPGVPEFATINLDGEQTRVYIRPMPDGGKLVVGQSVEAERTALAFLLVVLLGGGALGLLLSLGGAWFLAGRALVPIQQAFQRQQEFVADASHELRTPLTVLRTSVELLNNHRAEPLSANGELFDDVRHEISRLERLSNDLLTMARSDQEELDLMVAPLDVSALTTDVVRRMAPLAQSREVQLTLVPGPEAEVEADPDRLNQVLLILLDNAVKHTPAGGNVEVRVRSEGQCAMVDITDTGSGIAPEHLPRVFDRFYRADSARARGSGGAGLGLAIAKMLVEAHEGELSLSSTVGKGTQATIRLPLADRPASLGGRLRRRAFGLKTWG